MRIGLLPANRDHGGVYQYSLAMIDALDPCGPDDYVLVHNRAGGFPVEETVAAGWAAAALPAAPAPPLVRARAVARALGLRRALRRDRRIVYPDPDVVRHDAVLDAWLGGLGIDLMLYPVPTTVAFEVATPYVAAVHDLQHRLQPEFPEVSAGGEAETREYLFRNLVRGALIVLVDSEIGKEDALDLYAGHGLDASRVHVLPFVPPAYLLDTSPPDLEGVRERHGLPERYLFYPAQFWPHKNHDRLVRALALLRDEHGVEAGLVLCGSREGDIRERTHASLAALVRKLRLELQVTELGYVPDADMRALYAGAVALVMPTFFGPTNIPVLEAWSAGCPVITSDIRGIREQVGDAALVADPRSPEAIAAAIARLWDDAALAALLAERGRLRLRAYGPNEYRQRLQAVVEEARELMSGGERGWRQWR